MTQLDRRLHAYRDDLADIALKGQVEAEKFVEPQLATVDPAINGVADIWASPSLSARRDAQLLRGEQVKVFDVEGEYAWCQNTADDYVGYVDKDDLDFDDIEPMTHRVIASRTVTYSEADIKDGLTDTLPFGALVRVEHSPCEDNPDLAELDGFEYAFVRHIEEIDENSVTPHDVLELFKNVPYLWGGRSTFGVDCAGLVQFACNAAGIRCPFDSDQQASSSLLGDPMEPFDPQSIDAGDLVFWKGHVGIMSDDENLVHANAFHMQVATEPLMQAVQRIEKYYARPTGMRKLALFDR